MEVTVEYRGAVQFDVRARNHTVICDQPQAKGGLDEGMTPPEFLLASLGTCAGYYALQYLTARNLDARGLSVRVTADTAKGPTRLSSFQITVDVPLHLDERHRASVLQSVKSCLIHNTLLNPPNIDVHIVARDSPAVDSMV